VAEFPVSRYRENLIASFAKGMEQGLGAVTSGLTMNLEFRVRRGPREPHQDDQVPDVVC
jgi:hypothetical protein